MTEQMHTQQDSLSKSEHTGRRIWWLAGALVMWLALPGTMWGQWSGTNPVTTTNSVGIGTTTPLYKLHVLGSAYNIGVESTGDNYNVMEFKTATAAAADKGTVLRFHNQSAALNGKIYDIFVGSGGWFFSTYNDDWSGGATRMYIGRSGNVGIGTTAPGSRLEVKSATNDSYAQTWTASDGSQLGMLYELGNGAGLFRVMNASGGTVVNLVGDGGNSYITTGNVGIGTTNPAYKLSVNGTIQAKEVLVNTGWADHVFQPQYRLKPLREVASYIREKGHLPGIPAEAEVKEKGVGLGEMQVKLLEKIEELTLHMIRAEERGDRLEKENRALRERVSRLEAR